MSSNIEHIFYINMDKRQDRRVDIENDLKKYDLNAERFVGIPHEEGIVGCSKSHLEVIKLAKHRGYKNVLILEDDFTFVVSKEVFELSLNSFFNDVKSFDICMLCCNMVKKIDIKPYSYLDRIIECSNACAYIINSHYYDKIIHLYEWAIPLLEETKQHWIYANDQVWKKYQKTDIWYCFNPRLGKQKSGYSDNAKAYVDYDI